MAKGELKLHHVTFLFDDNASFEGKDGQPIKFISIRKVKYSPGENKPKFQNLTISHRDKNEVFEWLRKCLS